MFPIYTNSDAGVSFVRSLASNTKVYKDEMDAWVRELSHIGIRGAHPNDGWIDRDNNVVTFVYPHFDYGITPGDLIAIGDKDEFYIARVTEIIHNKFSLTTNQRYKFEYVWDFGHDN